MKLLGIVKTKDQELAKKMGLDGVLLPLTGWSSDYEVTFSLSEVKAFKNVFPSCFVIMNRLVFEQDFEALSAVLHELEDLKIEGILYYDEAVFELVMMEHMGLSLYLNRTHMTTSSASLNLYSKLGLTGAYLSNEITLDEILLIRKKTELALCTLLTGYPVVAHSRRKLVTNYQRSEQLPLEPNIKIKETKSKQQYDVFENEFGTTFRYGKRFSVGKAFTILEEMGIDYGIIEQGDFSDAVYQEVIQAFQAKDFEKLDHLTGRNRGFLYRKTIYRVKKV